MLATCSIRAQLSGYKSTAISLLGVNLSGVNEIGTILVYPANRIRGKTVCATSLLAPKKAKKFFEQAEKASKKNDPAETEKQLKSAVQEYPEYGEAWYQLGQIYQRTQRNSEARAALNKAIAIDSLYVNPYVQLGWVASREQKWQEGVDFTDKAIDLDPMTFPDAYYLSALANFNLGKIDVAEKRARQEVRLDSSHRYPQIYQILANVSARKNDTSGYLDGLRNYLKYAPNAPDAAQVRQLLQQKTAKPGAGK